MYEKAYKEASTVADQIRSEAYTGVIQEKRKKPRGLMDRKPQGQQQEEPKEDDDTLNMVLGYMTALRNNKEEMMSMMEAGTKGGIDTPSNVSYTPLAEDVEWIKYSNKGKIRDKPIAGKLAEAMSFLPEMGITMEVFSGGQDPEGSGGKRTGSTRHDHGLAADVFFYKDGKRLNWENPEHVPIFQDIVKKARSRGVTGIGAGENYMAPGSMHIGFGKDAVWGAEGKGANAAKWLREAIA